MDHIASCSGKKYPGVFHTAHSSPLTGLPVIERAFPDRFAPDGVPLNFAPGRECPGFSVAHGQSGIQIWYHEPCDAYRAVGLLLAGDMPEGQDRMHETIGVMWDVSRNGVINVGAWERIFLKFALMGLNAVQLYMEDVYEIPDEPFFGYGRGAYSSKELREIDDLGHRFGIEVIPCIQTLGHLEQIAQWPPYRNLMDVRGVLLVDEEATERLVGKMLDQMVSCFRSRKIHIGMDEAHGIGTGTYLRRHGYERPFDILCRHLEKVAGMCSERGLHPRMWSDMFFRIGSKTNDYYDEGAIIPGDIASRVPKDVDLVYWDYYHADSSFYEKWIQRHRAMGKEPIFAAGAWSWGRFWAYAPRWRENISAGMRAAQKCGIAQVWITIWGDDGTEFHPASVFPAIQYFAEWAYAGEPDDAALARQFRIVLPNASLDAYLYAARLDGIPVEQSNEPASTQKLYDVVSNFSKWILWEDPILGFLDAQLASDLPGCYRVLAETLDASDADEPVRFAALIARAVALKTELHLHARAARKAGNTGSLRSLLDEIVPECVLAVRVLWQAHRAVWREWYKPFGWEVIELRYAGIIARLESLGTLLAEISINPGLRVQEWEIEPLTIHANPKDAYFNADQAMTPSAIK